MIEKIEWDGIKSVCVCVEERQFQANITMDGEGATERL